MMLRLGDVVRENDALPPVDRPEHVGRRQDLKAVPLEVEIGDDFRMQQAHQVAEGRGPEAGRERFGDGRATDDRAALEHQRLLAGAGEIGGAGQPVVSGSDDDGVVSLDHPLDRPPFRAY